MDSGDWADVALVLLSIGAFLDVLIWPPLVVLDLLVLATAGYVLWFRRRTRSRRLGNDIWNR
jgi:Flp pilus assembly protein TadB